MPSHHYRFLTRWRLEATAEEVYPILDDTSQLPRWWPAVWLKADELDPGDAAGIGKRVRFTSKGWLPYILVWESTATEKEYPRRLALAAAGDFTGGGVWTLRPDGAFLDVEYDWRITADKPLLKHLSFLLKPAFAANHNWAMAKGLESLKLELARRRAKSPEELTRIPPPPGPTFVSRGRRRKLGVAVPGSP
jgi:Polyketide cyclase / dehydrase and lipid transport